MLFYIRKVIFLLALVFGGCTISPHPSVPPKSVPPKSVPPKSESVQVEALSFKQIIENAEKHADSDSDPSAPLKEFGTNWLFGQGFGRTAVNLGASIVFPPYAIYLLGNAGLVLAGYQPLYVSSAIPEAAKPYTTELVDEITAVPGRIAAKAAGERFRE